MEILYWGKRFHTGACASLSIVAGHLPTTNENGWGRWSRYARLGRRQQQRCGGRQRDGRFLPRQQRRNVYLEASVSDRKQLAGLASADFNLDGIPDLAATNLPPVPYRFYSEALPATFKSSTI